MIELSVLQFNNYKIAKSLPLDRIIYFFKLPKVLKWKEYVILDQQHIDNILQYPTKDKKVFVFTFGCVTFVNFKEDEIHKVLKFIESITGKIDYKLFAKFYENHTVKVIDNDDEHKNKLLKIYSNSKKYIEYTDQHIEALIQIIALVIAKSTALDKIEMDLNLLLDDSEKFILYLQKGKLKIKTKKFEEVTAKILRFEYDIINNIRIFDTEILDGNIPILKESYSQLEEYYEFHDRIDIIENKINNLRTIIKNYATLSYKKTENRLYWFQAFLLALFPFMYILKILPLKHNPFK